jgi:hypothetical protein
MFWPDHPAVPDPCLPFAPDKQDALNGPAAVPIGFALTLCGDKRYILQELMAS